MTPKTHREACLEAYSGLNESLFELIDPQEYPHFSRGTLVRQDKDSDYIPAVEQMICESWEASS